MLGVQQPPHAPLEKLHYIHSAWPFAFWGMDILGPFFIAKGQVKYLLVPIEYFTKWIEAEPLAKIIAQIQEEACKRRAIRKHESKLKRRKF